MGQAGGKLPLFDEEGQEISAKTIRSCVEAGWAEPWFANPVKPDWLVCRLTPMGRGAVSRASDKGFLFRHALHSRQRGDAPCR